MEKYIVKENKITGQFHDDYQLKEGETTLVVKSDEWPILKRTGGKFFEININEKQEGDLISGAVTKFKVKREKEIKIIERSEKLETDELLEFVQTPDMIRVYRGGTSVLTTVDDFDHATEAIEKSYTKHDLRVENGKPRLRTDPEILDDEKEKAIKQKAQELSKDAVKMVDGTAQSELQSYIADVNKVKNLDELKLKL